jgi:uncharacterized protein (UPF0261 family)
MYPAIYTISTIDTKGGELEFGAACICAAGVSADMRDGGT